MKKLLFIMLTVAMLAATLTACSNPPADKTTTRATEAPGIEVTTAP